MDDPRTWYQLERWRRIRRYQLQIEPLCRMCLAHGRIVEATVADHIENHEGNWIAFLTAPLQSLCKECHDGDKRYWDINRVTRDPHTRRQIGADGWPLPEAIDR